MEKGHFGQYSGNARHSRTPVTKSNYRASVADDAAHIHYLKEDINYDAKHGHSDENMTADEKHISKLAGDMKYDKKHHSPFKQMDERSGKRVDEFGTEIPDNLDVSIQSAEALSNKRLDQERRINEALDLAEAVNQGEVNLNLGNIATDYPSGAQYIVGTGTGPEGVIGQGGGKTKYTRQGVTNRVNELREKMNEPGGVQSVFDELSTRTRYGAARLGDASDEFRNIVDPLGIRRDLGYTDKRKQYVKPGKTIYGRMQANKNNR